MLHARSFRLSLRLLPQCIVQLPCCFFHHLIKSLHLLLLHSAGPLLFPPLPPPCCTNFPYAWSKLPDHRTCPGNASTLALLTRREGSPTLYDISRNLMIHAISKLTANVVPFQMLLFCVPFLAMVAVWIGADECVLAAHFHPETGIFILAWTLLPLLCWSR